MIFIFYYSYIEDFDNWYMFKYYPSQLASNKMHFNPLLLKVG